MGGKAVATRMMRMIEYLLCVVVDAKDKLAKSER